MNIKKTLQSAKKFFHLGTWTSSNIFNGILSMGLMRRNSADSDPGGNFAGWAYFAVDKIAERVASIHFQLYRLNKKEEVEEVDSHEILDLLRNPNQYMTQWTLIYILACYLKIWGAAPLYIVRGGKGGNMPVGLLPMRPDFLRMKPSADGSVSQWEYNLGGRMETYRVEDVIYIYKPDLKDPTRGYGAFKAIALEIDTDAAAALWNKYFFENNAQPSGVLYTERKLDEETFERMTRQWNDRQTGPENAGKAALLEMGLKWQSLSTSGKDSGYIETRNYSRDAIITMLGLPKGLYISDNVNLANAEVAERTFASETINPMMRLITEPIALALLPMYEDNLDLTYESPIREDTKQILDLTTAGVNVWMTVNEARELHGMEPIDGGDTITNQSGVSQTGTGKKMTKNRAKMLEIKKRILNRSYKKKEEVDTLRSKAVDIFSRSIMTSARSHFKVAAESPEEVKMKTDRSEYLTRSDARIDDMSKNLIAVFDEQQTAVLECLKKTGMPKSVKSFETWFTTIANVLKFEVIANFLHREYQVGLQDGVVAISAVLETEPVSIDASPEVVEFLKSIPNKFAKKINDVTLDQLRASLSEASENFESIADMSARVAKVFDDAKGYRTDRIALTESGRAENMGRLSEMRAQGVKNKIWMATGINTRDSHMDVNGSVVGIEEQFSVGGFKADGPHDESLPAEEVINCRCSLYPSVK